MYSNSHLSDVMLNEGAGRGTERIPFGDIRGTQNLLEMLENVETKFNRISNT